MTVGQCGLATQAAVLRYNLTCHAEKLLDASFADEYTTAEFTELMCSCAATTLVRRTLCHV